MSEQKNFDCFSLGAIFLKSYMQLFNEFYLKRYMYTFITVCLFFEPHQSTKEYLIQQKVNYREKVCKVKFIF